jgi:hypothetical protein
MWYTVKDSLAIDGLFFNFLPSWWVSNYGLSFGERFVFDADYRSELHRFMERTVFERFPGLGIGSADPQPQVVVPDFGNAITAAAAGCEVVYPVDNYPWNQHLPWDKIAGLRLPQDLGSTFPYSEIQAQVNYLNHKLGKDVPPLWNSRGVLNDAALIGGPDFLTEFALQTPAANNLEQYSFGMLQAVIQANHERFNYREMVMLTNCTVMMVSPALFAQRLFPYDEAIYQQVTRQGQKLAIHHCGNFEKYAPIYRRLPEIAWLDIGWGSDYRLALDLFSETTLQYILSAVFVLTASAVEVQTAIAEILERTRPNDGWRRFRLCMPDIEAGTPDENLYQIFNACKTAR